MATIIPKATYKIVYEKKDVTADFSSMLQSIEFTDTLEGKAGSLTLEFADAEQRFLQNWFPKTTDKLEVWLGCDTRPLLYAQTFWVDEVSVSGSRNGTYCTLRCMSTALKNIIKGATKKAAEKDLKTLAMRVAYDLGLTLKGSISGSVFGNQTKADLAFLAQQATRNGYIVKVENGSLIIHKYSDLRKQTAFDLSLRDVIDFSYANKAVGKFAKCTVIWYDCKKKQTFKGSSTANITGGGEATIYESVESNGAASERAKSWLENKNKQEEDFTVTIAGDERALAGIAVNIKDGHTLNGTRIIAEAVHRISRQGQYITTLKLQK